MSKRAKKTLLILVSYSILVMILAVIFGLHKGGGIFKGFFEKPNWLLFPFFWLLVVPLADYTWLGFMASWRSFPDTRVLQREGNIAIKADDMTNIEDCFNRWRYYIIGFAVISSAIVNWFDIHDWLPSYYSSSAQCPPENDFNVAWLCSSISFQKTSVFTIFAYIEQFVIVALAFLALYQIAFHLLAFTFFERFNVAKNNKLEINLNHGSKLNEFGLEMWNNALNNIYWLLSAAVIVPIVSRYSQPDPEKLDTGQLLIQCLVPVLFLSPMIFTIIQRQVRLPKIWISIKDADDDVLKRYHDQKIWPLDRNWSSKFGIVLAFLLLSYLLGKADFEGLFRKLAGI